MLKIYESISKFLQFIINILFVLQIIFMIVVFLTASYWFFDLINSDIFAFVEPLANFITDFMRLFYDREVQVGGVYVDGALLLFDLIAIVFVFLISRSKYYIYRAIDSVNIALKEHKSILEEEFNKELQKEVEMNIKKANNAAVLVRFTAKNMMVDACWGGDPNEGVREKEEEAFKTFYSSIKNLTGCKFAKTDDKMLILLNDFNKIDNLLSFIEISVNRISTNMRKRKWLLYANIAVDVYDNKTNFKTDVYPVLEKLLTINHKNEPVCLGNFTIRYKLQHEPVFHPFMKGRYNLGEEYEVWVLVKKN